MPMASAAAHQKEFFPHQEAVVAEHTNFHFAASAPPLAVANVAFTGATVAEHGDGIIMLGHETHVTSLSFGAGFDAPNTAGGGRFTPTQPLDASGQPILRTNDRGGVLVQPNGSVTCGQHACGMVLNTRRNS